MTENHNPHPEVHDGVDENAIAQYLLAEPGFFERHAELLTRVQLASPNGGRTISLQERQAQALREKIEQLEHTLMSLMRHSNKLRDRKSVV